MPKECPEYKIAFKLDILKIKDQPTANIGLQVYISVNFVFICSILLAGREFKILNFQVACTKTFQTIRMIFMICSEYKV